MREGQSRLVMSKPPGMRVMAVKVSDEKPFEHKGKGVQVNDEQLLGMREEQSRLVTSNFLGMRERAV
jgi:hypothetical protein